jgi:hypothetical protein
MKNSDDGVGDGDVNDPFVCESTLVTRATAELNEEILEELSEEDRSIASVLDLGGQAVDKQSILRGGADANA